MHRTGVQFGYAKLKRLWVVSMSNLTVSLSIVCVTVRLEPMHRRQTDSHST